MAETKLTQWNTYSIRFRAGCMKVT